VSDYLLLSLEVELAARNTNIISTFTESEAVVEKVTCLKEKKAKTETINWVIILPRK
jgi:hypothetical protein